MVLPFKDSALRVVKLLSSLLMSDEQVKRSHPSFRWEGVTVFISGSDLLTWEINPLLLLESVLFKVSGRSLLL